MSEPFTFTTFLLSLMQTAAVHLGDRTDPVSGEKGTPNLVAAQQMIDILGLLEEKTKGNLSMEERQVLEQGLFELRLRYVQVRQAQAPQS